MTKKYLFYTAIILFPFFNFRKAHARQSRERHRSVTINQTVIDGKVISSDTIITYTDTTTRTVQSKEISMELPYSKGSTVHIDNMYRKLNIRQSKDNKVRLETTTFYYGEPNLTNEQWLEKLNIKMQNTDSGISIVSGGINNKTNIWNTTGSYQLYSSNIPVPPTPPTPPAPPATTIVGSGDVKNITINGQALAGGSKYTIRKGSGISSTAVFDEKGNVSYNSGSLKRELTIYLPAGAKLDVSSKYADVSVDHDVTTIKANISNASLDMLNADNATIESLYGNISTGNIAKAGLSIKNGKLSVKNVADLELSTRYAKVEADKIGTFRFQSASDDYDIDEVKSLTGAKTYGNLRVDKLTGNFELKGSSADVRIRNIEPSVSNILLDNKYADVQLPVTALKNYEVVFSGNYSSVFAPFERKDTTITTTSTTSETQSGQGKVTVVTTGTRTSATTYGTVLAPIASVKGLNLENSRRNGQSFTAAVGDTKGTHTIFKLVCNSCNVDFK